MSASVLSVAFSLFIAGNDDIASMTVRHWVRAHFWPGVYRVGFRRWYLDMTP